jgi:hypothetical protein
MKLAIPTLGFSSDKLKKKEIVINNCIPSIIVTIEI